MELLVVLACGEGFLVANLSGLDSELLEGWVEVRRLQDVGPQVGQFLQEGVVVGVFQV